jgi:glycosyltransferase involved in cell wall biosynthesis
MVNVCYLVDAPFLGGAERYVARLAAGLDRRRFRPSVVMRAPQSPGSGMDEWKSQLEELGIPVRAVPMNLPFSPHHAIPILRAIADCAPHVVHVNLPGPHDGQMGLLVPLSRMAGTAGVVVTEHLPMVDTPWKRGVLRRISYRWVDRVVTVSQANVAFLVKKQFVRADKVLVVYNGLDVAYGLHAGRFSQSGEDRNAIRASVGLPREAVIVVFVGNLLRHKGLHRVIGALSRLVEFPWHLLVVGEGPERKPCEQLLATSGLSSRATFVGRLPEKYVERLLGSSDLLVLPSDVEGMPLVIIEAMACGLPVVATAVYGIPEAVVDGETGRLTKPGDGEGLRDALADLIADAEEREWLGRNGRKRFEECFTLERQLRSMESLYLQVARL